MKKEQNYTPTSEGGELPKIKVSYIVEVKKNGKWVPVLPNDLKRNMYENKWIFDEGSFIQSSINNYLDNKRKFPEDSPTITILKEMYPKHKSRTREWLLNKLISGPHTRFMAWLYGTLICRFRDERGAFERTRSQSWATYDELEEVVTKLEDDVQGRIKDYSTRNVLINKARGEVGKPRKGDHNYDMYYIMETIYQLEVWEQFKGGIARLAEANGIYNEPKNVRAIWWME